MISDENPATICSRMILWRLRFITAEVVCSIQKEPGRYRLLVKRGDDTERDESLPDVTHAQSRAIALREKLISMGFTSAA